MRPLYVVLLCIVGMLVAHELTNHWAMGLGETRYNFVLGHIGLQLKPQRDAWALLTFLLEAWWMVLEFNARVEDEAPAHRFILVGIALGGAAAGLADYLFHARQVMFLWLLGAWNVAGLGRMLLLIMVFVRILRARREERT